MNAHPRRSRRRLLRLVAYFATFSALLPTIASACLWDHDTLRQERSQFPAALELITGKFLRHSPEFYEWRIKDRQEKLKTDPTNLAYHDDLAVAYSKVGRTKDAIATMQAKEKLKPGLYETYSNLGTFYILAGDFEAGLPYIDKALAINPEAHFGREKYQKWLVEYALTRKTKDGKIELPLERWVDSGLPKEDWGAFYDFLDRRLALGNESLSDQELLKATQGVLGMMRFANHDNPLLLEALGDLLSRGSHNNAPNDAKMLAARCYLQAAAIAKTETKREAYRRLAEKAIHYQTTATPSESRMSEQLMLKELERDFKKELADADAWYGDLRKREIAWIRGGKNVEEEFDRLYDTEPTVRSVDVPERPYALLPYSRISWPRTVGLVAGLSVVVVGAIAWRRRRTSVA